MNKRLLYRNKIVRLYEDDIWGIFFRKQKKRDLFFKKIGYQLFLEIFRKNTRAVKPTIFAWKKKIFTLITNFQYNNKLQQKYILFVLKKKKNYFFNFQNNIQNWCRPHKVVEKKIFFFLVKKKDFFFRVCSSNFKFLTLLWQYKKKKIFFFCCLSLFSGGFFTIFKLLIKFKSIIQKMTESALINKKVCFFFINKYLNYFVLPIYLNTYFYIFKYIFIYYKNLEINAHLQVRNEKFLYFEFFAETLPVSQRLNFEKFCKLAFILFIKKNKMNALIFGVNFFRLFNNKQLKIQLTSLSQNNKKSLRQKYKFCVFVLINYFSLFIKIQQQNLKLKYKGILSEVSVDEQPLLSVDTVLTLEKALILFKFNNFLQTLKFFRFFLYLNINKKKKNFVNSRKFLFNKNRLSFKNNVIVSNNNDFVMTTLLFSKKKSFFFYTPIKLRYFLKDKVIFKKNFFFKYLKKNKKIVHVVKKKYNRQQAIVQYTIRKKKMLSKAFLNKFSFFFSFVFFKNFFFENIARYFITKIVQRLKKKIFKKTSIFSVYKSNARNLFKANVVENTSIIKSTSTAQCVAYLSNKPSRFYFIEYAANVLKQPYSDSFMKECPFLWYAYYCYWRQNNVNNNKDLFNFLSKIALWSVRELNGLQLFVVKSQQRLWQAELYVKHLCLFLFVRKLITKQEVHSYYTIWCLKNKRKNLFYILSIFKKALYVKLLHKRSHYITLLQKTLQHSQQNKIKMYLAVLNKHIKFFVARSFSNNAVGALRLITFVINISKNKFIFANKLKLLHVTMSFKHYLKLQWIVWHFLNKFKNILSLLRIANPRGIIACQKIIKKINLFESKKKRYKSYMLKVTSAKSKKAAFFQKEFIYAFFCLNLLYFFTKHNFLCKNIKMQKRVCLTKTSSFFFTKDTTTFSVYLISCLKTNRIFLESKNKYWKKWFLFLRIFKRFIRIKNCLSLRDKKKVYLFLKLVKYTFFLKKKTWKQHFRFLCQRLNFLNFSLKAQASVLYIIKKFFFNKKFLSKHLAYFGTSVPLPLAVTLKNKKVSVLNLYLANVSSCYRNLIDKKLKKKQKPIFKKKVYWKFKNKFNVKYYFKLFMQYQLKTYTFLNKFVKYSHFFKYMHNFSLRSKMLFLLRHLFRYQLIINVPIFHFRRQNVVFFRAHNYNLSIQDTQFRLFNITTRNLNYWLFILRNKYLFVKRNIILLLKLYLVYVLPIMPFIKKISYLPRVFCSNVFTSVSFLFLNAKASLKQHALNMNIYLIQDFILNKKYKIYFYLIYKLWFVNQLTLTYVKYIKYFRCMLENKDNTQAYMRFIIKNVFFRRFLKIYALTVNNNLALLFKNILHFCFLFKFWVFSIFRLFFDIFLYNTKLKVQMGLRKTKCILFLQRKNEFNILTKILNLYLIKWTVFKWKKFFYVNKNLINTLAYTRRRVRRLLYTVRAFFYQKYNRMPDSDSIFNTQLSDIINASSDLKKDKNTHIKSNNKIFQEYVHLYIQKKQNFKGKKYTKNFELKHFFVKDTLQFKKTEYLLSFFASNHIYKYFNKLRRSYVNVLVKRRNIFNNNIINITYIKEYNPLFNFGLLKKYSIFLLKKIIKIKKQIRFFSLRKRKTTLDRMFTLDLYPVVKYVKKKTSFNSFYKYRMLKVWKFRKFYGCLTDYELNSICLKAYKYRGDIIVQFIILLEARIDTILYRTGFVTTMFEARQLINHGNFLVNHILIKKRSYVLKYKDILSLDNAKINLFTSRLKIRLKTQGLLFWPPSYLEVNYNYILIMFLYELLKINQIPYNFKLTGKDLNSILYYYY